MVSANRTRVVTDNDELELKPGEAEIERDLLLQQGKSQQTEEKEKFVAQIVWWPNVASYVVLHALALTRLYVLVFKAMWLTILWS